MKKHLLVLFLSACLLPRMVAAEASAPSRVLLIGDSMMRVPAHATELQLSRREGVASKSYTSLGSGLARLDAFDWMAKIDELVAEFDPDCSIAWFGTNDRQPMQAETGIIKLTDPRWEAEYARRVGLAMDKLLQREGTRVIWLELPDMREAPMQADIELINRIVKEQADQRERVVYFPARQMLGRQPGKFTMHVPGPTGMPIQVRDADGVHLSRPGADRMAAELIKYLFEGGSLPAPK